MAAEKSLISNCTFKDNTAYHCPVIRWQGDDGTIYNNTIINNSATNGCGAIGVYYANNTVISKCILINNTGANNAAVFSLCDNNRNNELNITECYTLNNKGEYLIDIGNIQPYPININNNIFLDNLKTMHIYQENSMKVNANYNWFGNTISNYKNKPINDEQVICDNWLFLKATANKGRLHALNAAIITLTLCNYDGENITTYNRAKLAQIKLTGTATKGKLNKINIPITGKIKYTAVSGGTGIVKLEGIKIISFKIKKVNPRLTAKTKTFYAGVKTKKYSVILKNSKKTPIKFSRISLKVNGKKYSVKTNKKGIATFKIKNLYKKKKYKAVISYKGSGTYKKVTRKVIIRCV